MQPQPETREQFPFDDSLADLLLTTMPLRGILRGQRAERLNRAWINAALKLGAVAMKIDETALPSSPRAAAAALFDMSMQLCAAVGVPRAELTQFFNDKSERHAGQIPSADDANQAIESCLALLAVLHARRLQGQAG